MGGEVVTPLDLQAIREACEKATAGPWYAMSVIIDFGDENGKSVVCERPVQRISYRGTPQKVTLLPVGEDSEFCAGARTWVPALLSRVEALEGALREVDARLAIHSSDYARDVSGIARRALEGGADGPS